MKAAMKFSDYAPTHEAAAVVGKTVDIFRYHARSDDGFPTPVKVGGTLFYRRADLAKWKREHEARKTMK